MELQVLVFQFQMIVWFGSLFMVTSSVPPLWSKWEVWTKCSRQCDWGVSLQKRRCLQGACQGQEKRYRTCKITDCAVGTPDFRAQQCALSNDEKHTDGKMYHWVPVEDLPTDQQCTLTCRAVGESVTKVLSPKVLDGTRCSSCSIDMCILGRCEPVGCDHQLNSTATVDMCGVCNGDNSTCKLMKGKWQALPSASDAGSTKDLFTMPRGSTLIRLTSKGPHLMGLSRPRGHVAPAQRPLWSESGVYRVGDTKVKYTRLKSGREHAYIDGPLADPVTVYVYFNRLESTPETVHYRYSVPLKYGWSHAWTVCSVTCGQGEQLKVYVCVNLATGLNVPESNCDQSKPQHERRPCSRRICPPQWQPEPWQPCSRTCSGGKQTRNVYCVRRALNNMMMRVEEDLCSGSKPNNQQNCNLEPCPHWMTGQWSQCSVSCGQGTKHRSVSCLNSQRESSAGCNLLQRPALTKACIVGVPCVRGPEPLPPRIVIPDESLNQPFYNLAQRNRSSEPSYEATEWGVCSVTCGWGTMTRSVRCKVYLPSSRMLQDLPDAACGYQAKPVDAARCQREDCPPPSPREGDNTVPAEGYVGGPLQVQFVWRYTGFTECSASCIGGLQESLVQCVHIDGETPVSDTLCDITSRPTTYTRVCNQEPCPPKWEVVLYKECSATCGGGSQFPLEVLCMRTNALGVGNTDVLPEADCDGIPVPSVPVPCGLVDCPAYWQTGPWSECTQSCGDGGLRTRHLTCMKRMGTGEEAVVDWHQCPFTTPAGTEACNSWACEAQHEWTPQEWSECSVTCGVGMMVRPITCSRHEPDGTSALVDFSHCPKETQPDHSQICQLVSCSEPEIRGNLTTYRQTDFSNKKRLVVGMTAYVMRGVTITVRCPVRNFKKSRIQWQRGPNPIGADDRRAKVLKEGTMRIRGVKTSDQGVYTCIAGPATERFILHVKDIKGRDGPSLFDVRWIIGNWSECSASCGGGIQRRSVVCQQGDVLGRSAARNLKRACRGLGQGTPEEERGCNAHPCQPHWASGDWQECTLACTGPALGTQLRDVYCEGSRQERLADDWCDADDQPMPHRVCHNTGCVPVWKESEWSRCSATCGSQGIQMRTIQCAYSETGILASALTCMGLKQPVLTQRCANMPDCPADECQDSIRFCSLVKRMKKCHLDAYRTSCCQTCS